MELPARFGGSWTSAAVAHGDGAAHMLGPGPAHGYRLIELVEDMVGGQTRVDPGASIVC